MDRSGIILLLNKLVRIGPNKLCMDAEHFMAEINS